MIENRENRENMANTPTTSPTLQTVRAQTHTHTHAHTRQLWCFAPCFTLFVHVCSRQSFDTHPEWFALACSEGID
jgi:hypothetical protein